MTIDDDFSLALWATNLSAPVNGIEGWVDRIETRIRQAAEGGAKLLAMPEYACEQWLSFKPSALEPTEEIAWMAERAPEAVERLRPLVRKYGVALLAGTMPWQVGEGYRNRAWLLLPDGREMAQDKLVLTPGEADPESWELATGQSVRIVEWEGLRVAVLICLDVEMPALSVLLAPKGIDLLLVPSMTSYRSGYRRVFGCAKARAVELMTTIAATGTVGSAPGSTQNPTNVSGCSVFIPCETDLGHDGVHAEIAPTGGEDPRDDPFLLARGIPLRTIREMRAGAAEVWPGGWNASHVSIEEA